jgi:hypothetical protein
MNTTIDISKYIHYNKKYAVLICRKCKGGIPSYDIGHHLREEHKYIPIETHNTIIKYALTLRLCELEQVATPPEEEGPICYLDLVEKGYQCIIENCKVCSSTEGGIKKHCNKAHGWIKGQDNMWEIKPVQRFFNMTHSKYI